MSGFPTVPVLTSDGQVSHVWQRYLQDQWRKLGQASNDAPINSKNITGILSSLNLNPNGILNSTNYCTVDSVDNGTTATIRCYGVGGVGTTWTRQVGSSTFGPYPALSQAGAAYTTDYYVMFNPSVPSFVITTNFADILPDGYFWCGKVTTVNSGGGGGTPGGGGSSGGHGGVCFSGNTGVITINGFRQFYTLESRPKVLTHFGFREAELIISPYEGKLLHMGYDEWVTPEHPFRRDNQWVPAEKIFNESKQFSGHVYNARIITPKDEERHYVLANGETVHNVSML